MDLVIKGKTFTYKYGVEGLLNYEQAYGSIKVTNLKEMSLLMLSMLLTSNPGNDIEPDDFYQAIEDNPGAFLEFHEAHIAWNKRQEQLLARYNEDKKKVTESPSL